MIFWSVSERRDGTRNGRIPICIEYSATRAARFAARTATNVARARISVPKAVASEAKVDQFRIVRQGSGTSPSGSGADDSMP